jgi:hypothetical protein
VTAAALLAVRLAVVELPINDAALFITLTSAVWLAFLAVAHRRIREIGDIDGAVRSVPLAARLILVYAVLSVILVVRSA